MDNPYLDIAQVQRPQMMPEAPLGVGTYAGLQYGNQQNRQNQSFDQANQVAAMQTGAQQQAINENMAGAPGRMANIEAGNITGQQNLDFAKSGTAIETKMAEGVAKLSDAQQKVYVSKMHIFADLANASPDEVAQKLKYYGKEVAVNGKDFTGLTPEQVISAAKGIVTGIKQSQTKYYTSMDTMGLKNTGIANVATIRANASMANTQLRGEVAAAIANLKASKAPTDPKTLEGVIAQRINKAVQEDGIPLEEAIKTLQPLTDKLKEIRSAGKPEPIDISKFLGGNAAPTPAPKATAAPVSAPTSKFVEGKVYTDAKGNKATYTNGKFVPVQ